MTEIMEYGSRGAAAADILKNWWSMRTCPFAKSPNLLIMRVLDREESACGGNDQPNYVWAHLIEDGMPGGPYELWADIDIGHSPPCLVTRKDRWGRERRYVHRWNVIADEIEGVGHERLLDLQEVGWSYEPVSDWALRHGVWLGWKMLFRIEVSWSHDSWSGESDSNVTERELLWAYGPRPGPEAIADYYGGVKLISPKTG